MSKLAFLARFEAKPGKEEEVAKFLELACDMAQKEPTTINWYAIRLSRYPACWSRELAGLPYGRISLRDSGRN